MTLGCLQEDEIIEAQIKKPTKLKDAPDIVLQDGDGALRREWLTMEFMTA